MLERHVGDAVLLRSRQEVALQAQRLWRNLLGDLSLSSITRNFHSGALLEISTVVKAILIENTAWVKERLVCGCSLRG
ncbi:MAG: hypothetical protein ACTSQX_12795 [Candidatus Heimdallarchaeota archaeon]